MHGTVLRQKGLLAESKVALEAAMRLKPEDPGPYSQMAQVLRLQGDAAGSSKYLIEASIRKAAKEGLQKEMFDRASAPRPKVIR